MVRLKLQVAILAVTSVTVHVIGIGASVTGRTIVTPDKVLDPV